MPNINVTNLSTASLMLPGLYYTDPVAAGTTVTFHVPDTDEYLGLTSVTTLITNGVIRVETGTDDTTLRPVPVYTTATLPAASTFPSGTLVWDSTRMKLVVSYNDVWRDETVVIAGTVAGLGALTNVPTNAIAFATDTLTLMRYTGAVWTTCSLSNPANVAAGVPAGIHFVGQLAYNTTTQALMVCTSAPAGVGVWDTVFVAPQGAAPPAHAAAVTGGAYFNTTNSRLSFYNGAAWVDLPVTHFDTTANIATAAGAVTTVGQWGWDSVTNRPAVCINAVGPVWFNETTVTMDAPVDAHAYVGAVVFDPTGFVGSMAGHGRFQVCTTDATPGPAVWTPSDVVVNVVNTAGIPANATDYPEGTLQLDSGGGPQAYLYAVMDLGAGKVWVTAL